MIKGIYISNHNLNDTSSGVTKKIRMQIYALQKLGMDIVAPNFFENTILDKILRRLPLVKSKFDVSLNKYILEQINNGLDFVYIRHSVCNIHLLRTLKLLKENKVLIVYEFPTYPYDRNGFGLSWKLFLLKDKFSRNKLKKYVDIGVNFSDYDEIFDIKCIKISNGINPDMVTPKRYIGNEEKQISFIGVALLAYWNGYDRLIKSIANYYNNNKSAEYKIIFNIVGNGETYKDLKKLSRDLGIEDKIIFHGFVSGKKLDEIYDKSDIGVGTLASFRKYKNHVMSTLKTKEYTAKGIPFIKCDPDKVFDDNNIDFCLNVSRDEEDLNMEEILNWYKGLCERYSYDRQKMSKEIRKFSFNELSWEKQLLPVVNYIREKVKK